MDAPAVEFEAQILGQEIAAAVERVLEAAETVVRLTHDAEVRAQMHLVLEACAVGDLASQSLERIGRLARN